MKLASLLFAVVVSILVAAGVAVAAESLSVKSKTVNVPSSPPGEVDTRSAAPLCANRKFAVAGGFDAEFQAAGFERRAFVLSSKPKGNKWRGLGFGNGSEAAEMTIDAYCSKRRPQATRSKSTRIAPGRTGTVSVRCPRGTGVLGLGHEGPVELGAQGARVGILVTGARLENRRTVRVDGMNIARGDGARAGRLTGFATCGQGPRLETVDGSSRVGPGQSGVVRAQCRGGAPVAFGGFSLRPVGRVPVSRRQFVAARSARSGPGVWTLRAANATEDASVGARVYGYCAR